MKKCANISCLFSTMIGVFAFSILSLAQSSENKTNTNGGKVDVLKLKSTIFDNTRSIRILLPPGYSAEDKNTRYPVFYFNDGSSSFGAFKLREVIPNLIKAGTIPPMIIVEIDNGASTDKTKNQNVDRADEFLPYPDAGFLPNDTYPPVPPSPHGKLYPDFVINEVMPLINSHYQTKTGPENTSLGGASYGGVAALYTVINHPGVFGKLLLESTPLWIGPDSQILKDAQQTKQWPDVVYIGLGSQETPEKTTNEEGKKKR